MEKEKFEKLPAEYRANMLQKEESIFFNVALFEQAQRVAQMFANSTMVPKHFQGNVGNCMIGLNYAARMNADPFMVFQSLYVVHGRPGIEAKLVEAGINQSNKYSEPLQYEWLDPDDNPTKRSQVLKAKDGGWGCQAFTLDKKSGKVVTGPKITWDLVKGMGWYDKPGPTGKMDSNMWRNMTEMMFCYRAASWFANKNCPEVKLGMLTKEELEESIIDITPQALTLKVNGDDAPPDDAYQKNKLDEKDPPGLLCPHEGCGFTAASERGLKKHITQSHPLKSEGAKKHFGTDSDDIQISGETLKEDEAPDPTYLENMEFGCTVLGEDRYKEILGKFHVSKPEDVPKEERQVLLDVINREIDKANEEG